MGFSLINKPFWGTPIYGNPDMIGYDQIFLYRTPGLPNWTIKTQDFYFLGDMPKLKLKHTARSIFREESLVPHQDSWQKLAYSKIIHKSFTERLSIQTHDSSSLPFVFSLHGPLQDSFHYHVVGKLLITPWFQNCVGNVNTLL